MHKLDPAHTVSVTLAKLTALIFRAGPICMHDGVESKAMCMCMYRGWFSLYSVTGMCVTVLFSRR